jgi:integrase
LRIPLSKEALEVIEQVEPFARGGFLFPGKSRGVISDMTLSQFMTRRGVKARPHGFRSSLRTWLAENTDAPHEVAEMMLGHRSYSDVVRAYRRTDYFEQRLALAERWAAYVTGANSNLVKIVAAR